MAKAKAKPAHKARSKSPKVANTEAKVYQNRLQDGKRWVYEILPNQVYGCKTCRFIFGAARLVARKGSVAHRQQLPDRFRVASWLSPLSVGCGGGEREQQEPANAGKQKQSELS